MTARDTAFLLAGRRIALDVPPLLTAELSGNHGGSFERALQLVEAAAAAGAHALKLQTYSADTMTLDISEGEFFIDDPTSLWAGNNLYELYDRAHTPWDWHEELFRRARELGMIAFSTPFDETAVDFLETLEVPCYKIASMENTDIPLVAKVASTGKPMLISTGMATPAELDETVRCAREAGCRGLVLLKCTSTYPAAAENSNLLTIPHMRALFECEVGLSDHTLGIGASVAAVALGASVIERHLTVDRTDGAVDSAFSLEPEEFARLVDDSHSAWRALGTVAYGPSTDEERAVLRRRSLYIAQDVQAGDILTTENLRCVRPGLGLPPKYYQVLLGRSVVRGVTRGTPMSWDLVG